MTGEALDAVDRGILAVLGEDARNTTARDVANRVDVSPSTVRNRLARLEADGVVRGYYPDVDYEAAGMALQVLLGCTVVTTDRTKVGEALLAVDGVVDVRETLPTHRGVHVECVATDSADVERVTDDVRDLGLTIERADVLRARLHRPTNHPYFYETAERTPEEG